MSLSATSPAPFSASPAPDEPRRGSASMSRFDERFPWISWALWPLAILTALHKIWASYESGTTDDFTTVWEALNRFWSGVPVYSEDYTTTDPHYLYLPGGTMLLSPLSALGSFEAARALYVFGNAIAIVIALGLLSHIIYTARGWSETWLGSLSGALWPLSIIAVFNTEAVKNNLLFANINGVLLLLATLFLYFLLRDGVSSQVFSGLALGLAITIKPQFIVLLFLPFFRRQWLSLAAALLLPIVCNVVGWVLMAEPQGFVDNLVPYLGEVRDFANSSIVGVGVYFGASAATIWLWRILAAVLVLIGAFTLLPWRRSTRHEDRVMWAFTTSSLLLIGVFLVSSLGQMYYSLLIVPLLFTAFLRRSTVHNPVAWLGVYLCLAIDSWYSDRWFWAGRIFETLRGTVGWMLLLVSISITALIWLLNRSTPPTLSGRHRKPADENKNPSLER
ncbi:DUF2029 domain-containing protein [Corynebacterium urealyticum]|nr:DUF2029 domain-containing protein [Corynebacterium urealyticum]